MRAAPFHSLVVTLLVLIAALTPAWPAGAQNADADLMADVSVARASERPLAGPLDGTMTQSTQYATREPAGVQVGDFSAHVAFTNPSDGAPWDFGFDFGRVGETGQRIVVDSSAGWTYIPSSGAEPLSGSAPSLSPQPGARKTLDLLVQGDLAILSVSGVYMGSIPLTGPVAGEVSVTTGVFDSTTVEGRIIPFTDFTVWGLPGSSGKPQTVPASSSSSQPAVKQPQTAPPVSLPQPAAQAPGVTPAQAPAQAAGTVDPEAEAVFAELLTELERTPPDQGPFASELVERGDGRITRLAGEMTPNAANFAAVITFINPADMSPPWAAGVAFRSDEHVVLAATGHVLAVHPGGETDVLGQATRFDPTPGARNTLQVIVFEDTVLIGVNGVPAASESLAGTDLESGMGVALVTGIFPEDQIPNRAIPYENYQVWYLP